MTRPVFRVAEIELFERDVKLRLPFRFGVVTLTACPQAFVRARIELADGSSATGAAAELMIPKWFDKTPGRSNDQNIDDLRVSLRAAADVYLSDATKRTAFGHSAAHHDTLLAAAAERGRNMLTGSYGPAVLDRAILDALCKAHDLSFYAAIQANLPGIKASPLTPDLGGFDLDGFFAGLTTSGTIEARHTVGLLDAITGGDLATRVGDGLPETLEAVIARYGHRYFKLKVGGDLEADLARLSQVARVLDRSETPYVVTLDGNEQYAELDRIVALWRSIEEAPSLARFARSVLTIEQPLPRDLTAYVPIHELAAIKPVLIDESDATYSAFPAVRPLGYAGVSSKSCKGVYKSLLNSARCARWNEEDPAAGFFLSGEDLTMQAGLGVQQDLALVNLLGLTHVERNGHHYVNGFAGSGAGDDEQRDFLAAHPGLYEDRDGAVRLAIKDGRIALASLDAPGFASGAAPAWVALRPLEAELALCK